MRNENVGNSFLSRELKIGIPSVQISTMPPIALMVRSNRIIPGGGIIHPVGNAELNPSEEKRLRKAMVKKALEALADRIDQQVLYERVT